MPNSLCALLLSAIIGSTPPIEGSWRVSTSVAGKPDELPPLVADYSYGDGDVTFTVIFSHGYVPMRVTRISVHGERVKSFDL